MLVWSCRKFLAVYMNFNKTNADVGNVIIDLLTYMVSLFYRNGCFTLSANYIIW